jgi:5'-nucleotidase
VDQVAEKLNKENESMLSEVIGKTSVLLDGERENARTKETNLGDLTADAMRHGTKADVALTNGGGIRASIKAGDITKLDMVTVFPFGNYVVTKYITGEALIKALELGVSGYPATAGGFPQVSGIKFSFDASKPAGSRVKDVEVNGKPIYLKEKYLLATNDFMAAGGDDYTMFADFQIENEFGALEEILMAYIKELGVVDIQTDGRIKVAAEAPVKEPEETKEPEVTKEKPAKEEKKEEVKEPKKEKEKVKEKEKENKVKIYVVKKGDYLKKIAKTLFGKESEWKKIYEWNKDIIKNPDQIQIGQKFKILPN